MGFNHIHYSAIFDAADEDYTSPDYEGDGTELLMEVGYGTSFQGVTTTFLVYAHTYYVFSILKKGKGGSVSALYGASLVLLV